MANWWVIDGNNVYGSRPDGWWNDRHRAAARLAQRVAEWCRTHDDSVTLVFDAPIDDTTLSIAGGNLTIIEAPRRGRNAADDHIVTLVGDRLAEIELDIDDPISVVTNDRGLQDRLPPGIRIEGVGRFRCRIGY